MSKTNRDKVLDHIFKCLLQFDLDDGPLEMVTRHPDGERILVTVDGGPDMAIDVKNWSWPEGGKDAIL